MRAVFVVFCALAVMLGPLNAAAGEKLYDLVGEGFQVLHEGYATVEACTDGDVVEVGSYIFGAGLDVRDI